MVFFPWGECFVEDVKKNQQKFLSGNFLIKNCLQSIIFLCVTLAYCSTYPVSFATHTGDLFSHGMYVLQKTSRKINKNS
jgi:hypothetical protein